MGVNCLKKMFSKILKIIVSTVRHGAFEKIKRNNSATLGVTLKLSEWQFRQFAHAFSPHIPLFVAMIQGRGFAQPHLLH